MTSSMEWKGAVKREDSIRSPSSSSSSSLFSDHLMTANNVNPSLSGMFDLFNEGGGEKMSSLGFMELLGLHQDFTTPPPPPTTTTTTTTIFDGGMLQFSTTPISAGRDEVSLLAPPTYWTSTTQPPSVSVVVDPTTPNSSTISSQSSGAHNDEQSKEAVVDDQEEEELELEQQQQINETNKQLKAKKTSENKTKKKRQEMREPRFAFMTRSEVDHLEDGYRWRKYGQKAVKNSPFPRSYYRCTNATCNVKKRVERCLGDPTIVVTTYQGKHTHPIATTQLMSRPHQVVTSTAGLLQPVVADHSPASFSIATLPQLTSFNSCGSNFLNPSSTCGSLLTDHGLLQDIVPSLMRKEE